LDGSQTSLRKFGVVVGGAFLALFSILFIVHGRISSVMWIFGLAGAILIGTALVSPRLLRIPRWYWMGFAISLGWIVSRFLMVILFFLAITPMALIARIVRKTFLDIRFRDQADSYWIPRKENDKIDYTKMY
jgi:hypothetical protein